MCFVTRQYLNINPGTILYVETIVFSSPVLYSQIAPARFPACFSNLRRASPPRHPYLSISTDAMFTVAQQL